MHRVWIREIVGDPELPGPEPLHDLDVFCVSRDGALTSYPLRIDAVLTIRLCCTSYSFAPKPFMKQIDKDYQQPFLIEPTKLTRLVDKIHDRLGEHD